jgi:phosphohistidine phosphatase SixA
MVAYCYARSLAWVFVALLCGLCGLGRAEPGVPDPADALSDADLAKALRQGGYVIYFRHADTGPAYAETQPIDFERCDTQRNLNDDGRADARSIGESFHRLRIPVGDVLTSEFCRCWQTAELAFGRYKKARVLTGVGRGAEAAGRRKEATDGLRKLLGTPPRGAANTVLVSHGFNLLDAEGFHLGTQGEAAIFRPDGRGAYALIARVTPDRWASLPDPVSP